MTATRTRTNLMEMENDGLDGRRSRASSTLSRVFRPDPNEEPTVVRPSNRGAATVRINSAVETRSYTGHKEDPPLKYHPLCSFSFIVKIAQVLTTITCAGLYTEGIHLMTTSITSQMFPNIVFASYLIITPVILLSYMLGQKMPELLVRIFNILGAILFSVSGLLTVVTCVTFMQDWYDKIDEADGPHDTDDQCDGPTPTIKYIVMLIAQGVLSLFNSLLYVADIGYSIHRTLSYL